MKVLFQHIDRYQESTPDAKVYQINGSNELTDEILAQIISRHFGDISYDEALEDVQNWDNMDVDASNTHVCLWGEETDMIFTNLDPLLEG